MPVAAFSLSARYLMNRNTLLCALPLLASGIGLPVMAADIDTDDIQQKVDTGLDQAPASKPWKVRAGLLIETENKEGQSFDKDGFLNPPCGWISLAIAGRFTVPIIRKRTAPITAMDSAATTGLTNTNLTPAI